MNKLTKKVLSLIIVSMFVLQVQGAFGLSPKGELSEIGSSKVLDTKKFVNDLKSEDIDVRNKAAKALETFYSDSVENIIGKPDGSENYRTAEKTFQQGLFKVVNSLMSSIDMSVDFLETKFQKEALSVIVAVQSQVLGKTAEKVRYFLEERAKKSVNTDVNVMSYAHVTEVANGFPKEKYFLTQIGNDANFAVKPVKVGVYAELPIFTTKDKDEAIKNGLKQFKTNALLLTENIQGIFGKDASLVEEIKNLTITVVRDQKDMAQLEDSNEFKIRPEVTTNATVFATELFHEVLHKLYEKALAKKGIDTDKEQTYELREKNIAALQFYLLATLTDKKYDVVIPNAYGKVVPEGAYAKCPGINSSYLDFLRWMFASVQTGIASEAIAKDLAKAFDTIVDGSKELPAIEGGKSETTAKLADTYMAFAKKA